MEKRLVKIAKELNVGTTTIVEFLHKNGYEIENKPTAWISDDMHTILVKEFQKSIDIKEQADQLVIGTRPAPKKDAPVVAKTDKPQPGSSVPVRKEEETSIDGNKPAEEEKPRGLLQNRLKILGKIDLDAGKPKSKQEPAPELPVAPVVVETPPPPPPKPEVNEVADLPAIKEEAPVVVLPPVVEVAPPPPAPPVEEVKPVQLPVIEKKPVEPAPAPVQEVAPPQEAGNVESEDAVIRAEAPELRGLKIMGKIDTSKFQPEKKKKKGKEPERKPASPATPASATPTTDDKTKKAAPAAANDDAARKRKRKRKKVATESSGQDASRQQQQQPGARRKDGSAPPSGPEVKEVSQKEIEDKIKATIARLSGGGKKKRQKLQRDKRERMRERQEMAEMENETGKLQVTEFVTVSELASLMNVSPAEVIMTCLNVGVVVGINQRLDAEVIDLVATEFGFEIEFIGAEATLETEDEEEDDPADLVPRAPIVTVMGHVDHGKTSLLDHIRKSNVVEGEAGGITQHIGAYEVDLGSGKKVTFLDTPGHEAFTAMRARGTKVTDIAVIVVAADDSIMPQTREAISHAQAAGVPIVFAINKIDKDGANPERIKQELASMDFLVEEWGGKYQSQDISAKHGTGMDMLLEKILLEAEIQELKANPGRKATGTVIEASLDKGRGYVSKLLVQNGTLNVGDPIVAGEFSGKVKAMYNERGKNVKSAGPSTAVLVLGLSGAPTAGERFKEVEHESEAREIAGRRAQIAREQTSRATKRISLDEIGRRLALGNFKELNLIVKGDVDGSIEALSDSLIKLSIESVKVNVIHKAVGAITESDILLASASDAIIIGFQVRPSATARKLAEREGVEIKLYSIIYEAIEEIKMAIEGMLEPTREEKIIGSVDVKEVFKITKVGTVAGCQVAEGKILRNSPIRLIRDGIVTYPTKEGQTAEIASLKRVKDDVKEVRAGMECGIAIKNFNDIKVGDVIEAYEIIETKQKL
ncbi:MAG: translation initiation factor IF-2 [Saprospiraceae bacterium]|nr:translation initiation factor IF-2 [Saprospiraceae bacterium]